MTACVLLIKIPFVSHGIGQFLFHHGLGKVEMTRIMYDEAVTIKLLVGFI